MVMKKLLFLIFIGASCSLIIDAASAKKGLSKKTYELYRDTSYLTNLTEGAAKVLLSNQTGKPGTWGPTKIWTRGDRPMQQWLKIKTNTPEGMYTVYIKNESSQPDQHEGEKFVWISMEHIYEAIQKNNPKVQANSTAITLDPYFFKALVNDYKNGKNTDGFVSSSVNITRDIDGEDLDSSVWE
jgi:hypothetical protein